MGNEVENCNGLSFKGCLAYLRLFLRDSKKEMSYLILSINEQSIQNLPRAMNV